MMGGLCRACAGGRLTLLHDFTPMPLAGVFPQTATESIGAARYPLRLCRCRDCGHLQVIDEPPIDLVFHDSYRYATSTVTSLVTHFAAFAKQLSSRLPSGARLLEFGCNDGALLSAAAKEGLEVVGVDASRNVVELARAKGMQVYHAFFDQQFVDGSNLAGQLDVVTCSNVLAHVGSPADTLRAAMSALKPGGLLVVEAHDGATVASGEQFDFVYHEHLSYFTRHSICVLLARCGFAVESIDTTDMHGGSLRVYARAPSSSTVVHASVGAAEATDVTGPDERVGRAVDEAAMFLHQLAERVGPLVAYGAAGRAQVFVNMTKTGHLFSRCYDDSPLRQNRYIVGTEIPIKAFDHRQAGGACVVLAWNYASAIAARLEPYFEEIYTVLPQPKRLH